MPTLVITHQPTGNQQRMELSDTPFTIGRGPDNDLVLPDRSVSKQHCRILEKDDAFAIEDVGSRTGTYFNGTRIDRISLFSSEDQVRVGEYQLELAEEDGLEALESVLDASEEVSPPKTQLYSRREPTTDLNQEQRERACQKIRAHPQLARLDLARMPAEALHEKVTTTVGLILDRDFNYSGAGDSLTYELLNEALGLGPLDRLLADDTVDEIMVNDFDTVYVERRGKIVPSGVNFENRHQILNILRRMLAPIGRHVDEASPMVDARLSDGSRVNAIIPPLTVDSPLITIRKFGARAFTINDLIRHRSLTKNMARLLKVATENRLNILVSGGTGSGKTTLLNVLSSFISDDERIVTIEDALELRLNQPHVLSLEAKPPDIKGEGAIPIRKLLVNSLRMRPDRIVVGECRSGEALDMLQAMNTGHDGSLTSLHANSPRDALSRLETLVMMSGIDLPVTAIRRQVASAIDMIIQQTRISDGSRKVVSITELAGLEGEMYSLNEIFRFEDRGMDGEGRAIGRHVATESVPQFVLELRSRGISVDLNLFKNA